MKKLLTLILLAAAPAAFAAAPYAAATAGYLIDGEQGFFAARIGSEVAANNGLIHSIEGEVGFGSTIDYGLRLNFVPVMVNYRLRADSGNPGLSYYIGGGAGASRQKLTGFIEDDAWAFALQAFGGIEYKLAPTVSMTVGARYLWINKYTLANVGIDSGDDVALEIGFRVRM